MLPDGLVGDASSAEYLLSGREGGPDKPEGLPSAVSDPLAAACLELGRLVTFFINGGGYSQVRFPFLHPGVVSFGLISSDKTETYVHSPGEPHHTTSHHDQHED